MEQLRPYDPEKDQPKTGWDAFSIEHRLNNGVKLYVDEFNEVWTENKKEYAGRIRS